MKVRFGNRQNKNEKHKEQNDYTKKIIYKMGRIGVAMIGILLWAPLVSHGILYGQERPVISKNSAPSADDKKNRV